MPRERKIMWCSDCGIGGCNDLGYVVNRYEIACCAERQRLDRLKEKPKASKISDLESLITTDLDDLDYF